MTYTNTQTSVETWQLRKPAVKGRYGIVSTQHYAASDVGANVLKEGGNAIDAAVAASLMIGTVEPWMSGLGGGGFMLYYDASTGKTHSLDFGMRAPLSIDPTDYPLVPGQDADLFGWPSVLEDRNVQGPLSIAVPGYLSGIETALALYGTQSFSDLINPALVSARTGMSVDWYASLKITAAAHGLSKHAQSAETYLPGGFPPAGEWGGPLPQITLGNLANTLDALQRNGTEDFYQGEIAERICRDATNAGSKLTAADLSSYQTTVGLADTHTYRDANIYSSPGLTAGPTLIDTLTRLESRWKPATDPDEYTFQAYASSLSEAYKHRLSALGDSADSVDPACTTHLSVVDRHGNMVSLTQTLLSVFGSKVMLPETGILMNNGIMWFDPRKGQPNSFAPGKKPLSNMCPTLLKTADGNRYALGASGGRRIMPAVAQLISLITDYGMTIDEAIHHGRIDVSGSDQISVDQSLGDQVAELLSAEHQINVAPNGVYPALFACPNIVACTNNQEHEGVAYISSPWAQAIAADPS